MLQVNVTAAEIIQAQRVFDFGFTPNECGCNNVGK
jgi:hypothetical protein